ncbi:hypothetical protein C8R43DRAFT_1134379 [Mycena crocata]|nr:hypothetical protein C8R43DRAFT_1134379 [Mycena crocata]
MANQSKPLRPSTSNSNSRPAPAPPAPAPSPVSHQRRTKGAEHHRNDDADYGNNNDDREYESGAGEDEDTDIEDDDNDEDNDGPVRSRARRVSDKQAQLDAEKEEAKARKREKALKAEKAAKRKAGEAEEDTRGPIEDDFFTSRTVPSRPTVTKNLAQRNSRAPAPAKFASSDRLEDASAAHSRDSHGHHSDKDSLRRRDRSRSPSEQQQTFRGRSPSPQRPSIRPPMRNINGGIIPDSVTLHLVQDSREHHRPSRSLSPRRSSSPDVGNKRSRSSSQDSDDLRSTQVQRINTSGGGRPRAKDLDDHTKEFVIYANTMYRCVLSAINAMPDSATEARLVRGVWNDTCEELGERMILTPAIFKLITARGPQLRGELKNKIKPLTELVYGFKTGQNKKVIAFNRKLAEDLKEGSSFAFKHVADKKGLYKHRILQMAINVMWFANRRDEGPCHPEFFQPFPVKGLALVLTVIENTIDEYLTGIRTDVPFTANEYRTIYQHHIKSLEEFAAHTAEHKILDRILGRMHDEGRFHSGAQPFTSAPTAAFSKAILDAAIAEDQEGSTTEDDAED